MKIRFVKGPFGGKTLNYSDAGRNEIIYRGPKRMTRKARYEYERNRMQNLNNYGYYGGMAGGPQVEARYRLCMGMFNDGHSMVHAPLRHPDGSLFYEYVKDSIRELPW